MSHELMEQFVGEARELLESAATAFLALEKNPNDDETMNLLFRAVHTLKGTSGIFDVAPLTQVVHAAEDVLDLVRDGEMALCSDDIDLFLDSLDQVAAWIDDLEQHGELPQDAASISSQMVDKLRALLSDQPPATEQTDHAAADSAAQLLSIAANQLAAEQPAYAPDWVQHMLATLDDADAHAWYTEAENGTITTRIAIQYQPSEQCFFSGDDPLNNAMCVPSLCFQQLKPAADWADDDSFDPYACNLIFSMLSTATMDEVTHALRYVESEVQCYAVSAPDLVQPHGEQGDAEDYMALLQDAEPLLQQRDWQALSHALETLLHLTPTATIQASAMRWLRLVLRSKNPPLPMVQQLLETVRTGLWSGNGGDTAYDMATSQSTSTPTPAAPLTPPVAEDLSCVLGILKVQIEALSLPCTADMWQGRYASVLQVLNNLCHSPACLQQAAEQAEHEHSFQPLLHWVESLVQQWSGSIAEVLDIAVALAQQDFVPEPQGSKEASTSVRQPSFLRVEQARIDQLMDLVGELVVAKNGLPFLSDKAEREFGVKSLAREIKGQYEVVNRLAEEFQNIVMRIRMVSVSTVFQRFPRLVRDLSRRLDKKIELVIEGEDTEADKNVVEALSDPLIHLVRNSLDHGIEMPAERLAAGKPEMGKITLRAVQQEDQVLIEVCDDGKGLCPNMLKQKAYEKGLIDEEMLESMGDQDALQLILKAGFSMANEVSDLSGRGVGMDVVNSMVKEVGGNISLFSTLHEGTTVRLSLPLSMAVTRVMMVEVDGQNFGIPIEQIVETVKIPATEIHQVKNTEAIVLRDRLIPLRCLRHSLGIEAHAQRPDDVAVLVVSSSQGLLGLLVDEFHAGLDIIQKPLDGVMAGFPLFSGTALLGDGSVLLILNLEALSSCQ